MMGMPPESVASTHLARCLGPSMVIGSQEDCDAEMARLGLSRQPPRDIAGLPVEQEVQAWLDRGEVGASSETMACYLIGRDYQKHGPAGALPRDEDDFERCCLLLAWAPGLRDRLGELGGISSQWGQLAAQWSALEQMLADGRREEIYRVLQGINEGSADHSPPLLHGTPA